MRRVFVILGESRSRKSATIRALTGLTRQPRDRAWQVRLDDNEDLSIFIQPTSLQEARISPDGFIDKVNGVEGEPDILVALRPRSTNGGNFPGAMSYIERLEREGWNIVETVMLGSELGALPNELRDRFHDTLIIPDSREIPANETAYRIRSRWGWR